MILLNIAVFATSDSNWALALDAFIEGANYHLVNYDMRLHVFPPRPGIPIMLPQKGDMFDPPPDGPRAQTAMRPGDLRSACATAMPEGHGIPVIFTKFNNNDHAGLTILTSDTAANREIRWLNYVLIRENYLKLDRGVLLHELIHAANYSSPETNDRVPLNLNSDGMWEHDVSDRSSIMIPRPVPGIPTQMYARHAMALRRAYFARYV